MMKKEEIVAMRDSDLWHVVRYTVGLTEQHCNKLTWAKEELRRRGYTVN